MDAAQLGTVLVLLTVLPCEGAHECGGVREALADAVDALGLHFCRVRDRRELSGVSLQHGRLPSAQQAFRFRRGET